MPEARVDGRRVAWREAGAAAGEPMLLLHCALAHSGAWSGVMARLGPRFAMRAIDLPGHGGTDHDPALGFQDQAVANACALLAATGPARVVGHSFGGTVALRLAVEAPGLVRALVLVEPVAFGFLADAGDPAYAREMADQAPFRRAAEAGDWRGAGEAFLARWGVAGGLAGLPSAQADYMLARLPFVRAGEADLDDHPARRLRLGDVDRVAAPVTLVEGSASPPVIGAILDAVAARLPRARRVVVPGAGHMLPVTHPESVARALEAEPA